MKIPLHCLVLDFRDLNNIKINKNLPEIHNELSYKKVHRELFGKDVGYYINNDILHELRHRCYTKLWLGERVVVQVENLKKK